MRQPFDLRPGAVIEIVGHSSLSTIRSRGGGS
jgi:hypothetical protein